jgi:glycosyltransferase involved in cell wall biosynthesis
MVASKMAGVPIRIHTFTGLIFPTKTGLLQKILIAMDKILCKAATNIYPEGNGVKTDLENYKITNKPLSVIANGNVNGIDLTYFDPKLFSEQDNIQLKKELNIKKEDFVFIFVGRLVRDKGINELVKAFSILNRLNTKLLLVGPLETELDPLDKETLAEIKNNKNIISVGYQDDVRPFFSISNALAFPSYREGFPNVVLQAGAMNLPGIVTNINGCNEIIEEGKNGFIIPVKNMEVLCENMSKIIDNTQFKLSCREMIRSRFEQKMMWEALMNEYKVLENNV